MGASSGTPSKPLARLFGADEQGRRGPTLGGVVVPDSEGSWRIVSAGPRRIQVFDAYTADAIALQDLSAAQAIQEHFPFTTCSASEEMQKDPAAASGEATAPLFAVGCQDGTILVFSLEMGTVRGPLHVLRAPPAGSVESGAELSADGGASIGEISCGIHRESGLLEMSITVLHFSGQDFLFAGSMGRCTHWDLRTGTMVQTFQIKGSEGDDGPAATPSTLVAVRREATTYLWVGTEVGNVAVFDVHTGELMHSFGTAGTEALVTLAHFPDDGVIFALSAHRKVAVWDACTYTCIQRYPAELMTCGADLSAMIAITIKDPDLSLLVLAGVDGSLCVRRVSRRPDGKLNCVLLSFFECVSGDAGAPITSLGYHAPTDSVLIGDAGCTTTILNNLKEQLGTSVQSHSEQQIQRATSVAMNTLANAPQATADTPVLDASQSTWDEVSSITNAGISQNAIQSGSATEPRPESSLPAAEFHPQSRVPAPTEPLRPSSSQSATGPQSQSSEVVELSAEVVVSLNEAPSAPIMAHVGGVAVVPAVT